MMIPGLRARPCVVAGLVAAFCVGNLLGPALFWRSDGSDSSGMALAAPFANGAFFSEFILLAIWCALGAQAIRIRLPLCVGLVIVAACTYIAGFRLGNVGLSFEIAIAFIVATSAFFACMLPPFWGLRLYARKHIVADHEAPSGQLRSGQFGVRYLLTMTGWVAVLLVLVKKTLPTNSFVPSPQWGFPWAPQWGQLITAGLVYAVFSSCLAIPCVWLALSSQHRWFWATSLAIGVLLGSVIVSIFHYSFAGAGPDWWEPFPYILSFGVGLVATTSAALLLLARLCGLRLSAIPAE